MGRLSTYQNLAQLIAGRIYNQRAGEVSPPTYGHFLYLLEQRGCADAGADFEAVVAEHVLAMQVHQKLGSIGCSGPRRVFVSIT